MLDAKKLHEELHDMLDNISKKVELLDKLIDEGQESTNTNNDIIFDVGEDPIWIYYIAEDMSVIMDVFTGCEFDINLLKSGNIFKTYEEAYEIATKFKNILGKVKKNDIRTQN